MAHRPNSQLASRVLPAPLYQALAHVFAQGIEDCMLVGGTALAGYYAGHRRSDDLDLFARDDTALRASVLAVESLTGLGAVVHTGQRTPQFFSGSCELSGHAYTVQLVVDPRLFEVGEAIRADDGVAVADLQTLLKQKAATLVSRCSEKDLFDLGWLFRAFPELRIETLVELGAQIDSGMTAESVMISVTGTTLRESACDISPTLGRDVVYREISSLKRALAQRFDELCQDQPVGPVGELIRRLDR